MISISSTRVSEIRSVRLASMPYPTTSLHSLSPFRRNTAPDDFRHDASPHAVTRHRLLSCLEPFLRRYLSPFPLSNSMRTIFVRQRIVACNSAANYFLRFASPWSCSPSWPSSATSSFCDVFLLIRRSHFSRQCRSRFRLTGCPASGKCIPPANGKACCQSVCFPSPACRVPGIASACFSAVVFFC